MSWKDSAVYHEARAAELQIQLDEARARIAQLEDDLTVSKEETIAAYQFTKPPVNIDTGAKVNASGGSSVKLPDPATGQGLAVIGAAAGVLGLVLMLKRK